MNSLQITSGYAQRTLIAFLIIGLLAIAAAAQTVQPLHQGRLYGDPGFRGEPINLNVVNADIRDILNYITEQYGINFVIDKSVKSVPVTVNVSEVPWNVALDSILRSQELGVQVNGTILRVADAKALATEGELYRAQMDNQLDGSPLYTEFIRLNYARASGTIGRGSATSGTSTVGGGASMRPVSNSASSAAGSASAAAGGEGLLPIIKRRLSRRGSIEVDGRSNSLIITDVRQNIDAIRQLVTVLDQPEPQVEIESRIVVATRTFSRDIGFQLTGLIVGPRGSGGYAGTLPGVSSDLALPTSLPNGVITAPIQATNTNTVIGLTTGIFGTAQISALLTAGEQKGQAKIIATPRVTTLNNRKAKIESKTQIPISTIQAGESGGDPIVTTTYIDVPLKLEITPQITDVGTVVLDVLAENAAAAIAAGGVNPTINTQIMETQVTVPDGGTTVVGGVLFDDERENQNRTPGLSRIPLLGNLFKRKGVERNTNEILFFITPRIARPDLTASAGSAGVKSSATIVQPVPLGNPTSNSDTAPVDPNQVQAVPLPVSNAPKQP
ncbi:MAG TPA: type IV pilus secretin PilQ [Pyrinomonadaceae bacterium]